MQVVSRMGVRLIFLRLGLLVLGSLPLFAQGYQVHYNTGPGDLLKISVINLEEMNGEYRIDSLGYINLPYIGRTLARGITIEELQNKIGKRLEDGYLNNPQVLVEIKEFRFQPISVIGAVQSPGRLETVDLDIDLIEALTQAGGITTDAGNRILVMRKSASGRTRTLTINLSELMIEGQARLNIPLFPGDTVNIPPQKPLVVSVLGEVMRPGEFKFTSDSRLTLLKVVATAGGFTTYARQNKITVKREIDGETKALKVNAKAIREGKIQDFEILHNDLIIVP